MEEDSNAPSNTSLKRHFLFDASGAETPISFEVIFRAAGYEYKYMLKLQDDLITEENLYATDIEQDKVILVFERAENITLGEMLGGAQTDILNSAMPLIQYLTTTYNFEITRNAIDWFRAASVANYRNPRNERVLIIPDDLGDKQRFYSILREMDIPIKNIVIEKGEGGKTESIRAEYSFENGNDYLLDLSQESAGTRKLLSLLALPLRALESGSVLFLDELDAKLHPKMIEYVITLFTNPASNKRGAQLIFTSHDLYTMNNTVFRRDEIWFAAKGGDLSSQLKPLTDNAIKRAKELRKKYDQSVTPSEMAPCTTIYNLIGFLREYV